MLPLAQSETRLDCAKWPQHKMQSDGRHHLIALIGKSKHDQFPCWRSPLAEMFGLSSFDVAKRKTSRLGCLHRLTHLS